MGYEVSVGTVCSRCLRCRQNVPLTVPKHAKSAARRTGANMVDLLVSEEGKRGYAVRGWRSRVLGPGRAGWERTRGQRREPLYSGDLVGKSFPHPRNCSDIRHWSTESFLPLSGWPRRPIKAPSSSGHLSRQGADLHVNRNIGGGCACASDRISV